MNNKYVDKKVGVCTSAIDKLSFVYVFFPYLLLKEAKKSKIKVDLINNEKFNLLKKLIARVIIDLVKALIQVDCKIIG